ncbi:uncharacterized protein BJ171DRAFT_490715 [Polychytrium aggregatum]|uniref:uncharacterized protein n=1 Tax=Polychytrium aggregatum TaxID=110093 RepID=UPI0022FE315D|nr:uncharacterized protein BJ171DRAFT_490715 [Polychytrium aggregatum]KAI9208231.1 hypothetical protein BJ171DRAFT_490715 [Polychytrium aggregatum]
MTSTLLFGSVAALDQLPATVVIGEKTTVESHAEALPHLSSLKQDVVHELLSAIFDGTTESLAHHYKLPSGSRTSLFVSTFGSELSRNNAPIRGDLVTSTLQKTVPKSGDVRIIVLLKSANQAVTAAVGVSRAFPLYTRKTAKSSDRKIHVELRTVDGSSVDNARIQIISNGVRFASRLVDTTPFELNTDTYLEEVKAVHARLASHGVELTIIRDRELEQGGFGGLWGVGKGADHPPALAILSYKPADAKLTMAWVGKGIIYDTGGLTIKGKDGMPGMKTDMGGSAAVLAGFEAAILSGCKHNLYGLLCLAENAVDSRSFKNDDILTIYSGKTVEINNTDAEGRLVLGDGVAYATKHLNPDIVIDIATLTGAQFITTGKAHCGVLSNNEELERTIIAAGKRSGDLGFPILYAPELLSVAKMYPSEVADMKNSVKDRMNAQCSAAGHFVEQHLVGDHWKEGARGRWAHIDIAAPSVSNERGTGFGVSLFVELAHTL